MSKNQEKKMSEIGERKFLHEIAKLVDTPILNFYDDVSAVKINDDMILVINADMLVSHTDVLPGMSYEQIGKKAVTMSVSDIVSKGVTPLGCMTSVAFPRDLDVDSAKKIILGIKQQCLSYHIPFLGGDLNEGTEIIIDSISFGTCSKDSLIPRIGASCGDIIYSTGNFGLTSVGFLMLLKDIELPDDLKFLALESVYNPNAKLQYLPLIQTNKIKVCMDSSDGLFVTLSDLSSLNGLGINLLTLPIHQEVSKFAENEKINPLDLVFNGGEEFELVFAISPDDEQLLIREAQDLNLNLIKIGVFTDKFKEIRINDEKYKVFDFSNKGYEHFR